MKHNEKKWKEVFEKEFLRYISHGFPRDIVLKNMQVFIEKELANAVNKTLQEVEEKNKKDSFYGLEVKKSNLIPKGEIWIGTGDENFIKIKPNLSAIKQEEV